MATVCVTVQNGLNTGLFQGPQFIENIYDAPVIRRIRNVECNDMQIFSSHSEGRSVDKYTAKILTFFNVIFQKKVQQIRI